MAAKQNVIYGHGQTVRRGPPASAIPPTVYHAPHALPGQRLSPRTSQPVNAYDAASRRSHLEEQARRQPRASREIPQPRFSGARLGEQRPWQPREQPRPGEERRPSLEQASIPSDVCRQLRDALMVGHNTIMQDTRPTNQVTARLSTEEPAIPEPVVRRMSSARARTLSPPVRIVTVASTAPVSRLSGRHVPMPGSMTLPRREAVTVETPERSPGNVLPSWGGMPVPPAMPAPPAVAPRVEPAVVRIASPAARAVSPMLAQRWGSGERQALAHSTQARSSQEPFQFRSVCALPERQRSTATPRGSKIVWVAPSPPGTGSVRRAVSGGSLPPASRSPRISGGSIRKVLCESNSAGFMAKWQDVPDTSFSSNRSSRGSRPSYPSPGQCPGRSDEIRSPVTTMLEAIGPQAPPTTLQAGADFTKKESIAESSSTAVPTHIPDEASVCSIQSPVPTSAAIPDEPEEVLKHTAYPPRRPAKKLPTQMRKPPAEVSPAGLPVQPPPPEVRDSRCWALQSLDKELADEICKTESLEELGRLNLSSFKRSDGSFPRCPTCAGEGIHTVLCRQSHPDAKTSSKCSKRVPPKDNWSCAWKNMKATYLNGGDGPIKDDLNCWDERSKQHHLGTWMVWMVHRLHLNDPDLKKLEFALFHMPTGEEEPRIAPKLVKALEHNEHLQELLLAESHLNSSEVSQLAKSLRSNKKLPLRRLQLQANYLELSDLKDIFDSLQHNNSLEELTVDGQRCKHGKYKELMSGEAGVDVCKAAADCLQTCKLIELGMLLHRAHWQDQIGKGLMRNREDRRKARQEARRVEAKRGVDEMAKGGG